MIWLRWSQTTEFRQRLLWYVGKKLTAVVILFRFNFSPLTKTWTRKPEKTADIPRRHWFSCQMTSEERRQKFHTDNVSLPRSGECFWLVVRRGKFASTNQKHHPDVCRDKSSEWNFCARFSDVILQVDLLQSPVPRSCPKAMTKVRYTYTCGDYLPWPAAFFSSCAV